MIPLDADRVARPIIGLGFSTARPLDIRAGGGEDEVSYNVNAPVSVDGGTGFDKVVVLGTEFADDIVITAKGIFGAGVNVRYANIEVVEVDGLEGDDEFFVQSTAFGVAYRVIGGLGSDTINVTGDVVEDIVVKELEGVSGYVNHLVTSGDPLYDGLVVDGIDLNVATPTTGNVIITETGGFTAVREGGPVSIDKYFVRLAADPGADIVYVTGLGRALAAGGGRRPQRHLRAATRSGSAPARTTRPATTASPSSSATSTSTATRQTNVPQRSIVLKFTGGSAATGTSTRPSTCYAVNDLRSEGDRVVAVSHSVISTDARYDGTLVRNVEVTVRDDDTPGVFVPQVTAGHVDRGRPHGRDRGRRHDRADRRAARPARGADPGAGVTIVVHLLLDADSEEAVSISKVSGVAGATTRPRARSPSPAARPANWNSPVRLRRHAARQRPAPGSADGRDPVRVRLDRRPAARHELRVPEPVRAAGARRRSRCSTTRPPARSCVETGGGTLVVFGGATDDYFVRLTLQPTGDGQRRDPHRRPHRRDVDQRPAGHVPADRRLRPDAALHRRRHARERRRRADHDHARRRRQLPGRGLRARHVHPHRRRGRGERRVLRLRRHRVDDDADRTTAASGSFTGAVISKLVREGLWQGTVSVVTSGTATDCAPAAATCRQIVRTIDPLNPVASSWLADGFLEGQRVRVCQTGTTTCADFKIALLRGVERDAGREAAVHVRDDSAGVAHAARSTSPSRGSPRSPRSPATTADANAWFKQQRIELRADTLYTLPPGRDNVKIFPVSTHLLSKLQGPLAVEGGPTAADRSLRNGVKLAGERDGALFEIPAQAPESSQIDVLNVFNDSSQADGVGHDDLDDADRVRHVEGPRLRHRHRRSASRRPSRAGSASGRSPSSTASSRPTAPRARSRC